MTTTRRTWLYRLSRWAALAGLVIGTLFYFSTTNVVIEVRDLNGRPVAGTRVIGDAYVVDSHLGSFAGTTDQEGRVRFKAVIPPSFIWSGISIIAVSPDGASGSCDVGLRSRRGFVEVSGAPSKYFTYDSPQNCRTTTKRLISPKDWNRTPGEGVYYGPKNPTSNPSKW